MPILERADKKLVKDMLPCPYCGDGIGHFANFDKHWNDIDDVEMGFPDVYYTPDYQCSSCGKRWCDAF